MLEQRGILEVILFYRDGNQGPVKRRELLRVTRLWFLTHMTQGTNISVRQRGIITSSSEMKWEAVDACWCMVVPIKDQINFSQKDQKSMKWEQEHTSPSCVNSKKEKCRALHGRSGSLPSRIHRFIKIPNAGTWIMPSTIFLMKVALVFQNIILILYCAFCTDQRKALYACSLEQVTFPFPTLYLPCPSTSPLRVPLPQPWQRWSPIPISQLPNLTGSWTFCYDWSLYSIWWFSPTLFLKTLLLISKTMLSLQILLPLSDPLGSFAAPEGAASSPAGATQGLPLTCPLTLILVPKYSCLFPWLKYRPQTNEL